jgi:hypothetical protein
MVEMKWFSSVMFGVSTANSLGFGLDLAGTCETKLLANDNSKEGMVHPKSATQSHLQIQRTDSENLNPDEPISILDHGYSRYKTLVDVTT